MVVPMSHLKILHGKELIESQKNIRGNLLDIKHLISFKLKVVNSYRRANFSLIKILRFYSYNQTC